MADGGPIEYDTLVVATGAHHTYFDHPEWATIAPGLKSIEDALEIRRRILIAFEAAEREADPERRRAWMTVRPRRRRADRCRARRCARRDRPRHAQARFPSHPVRPDPGDPARGDGPDPADLPARPFGLGAAPAGASRGGGPDEHPGDARRRGRRPVHRTRRDRGIDRGPDRLLDSGRAHRPVRADRGRGDRRLDRSRRAGHRRTGPDDPRAPGDLRRRRRGAWSRGSPTSRRRASRRARCRAAPTPPRSSGAVSWAVPTSRSATATTATWRSSGAPRGSPTSAGSARSGGRAAILAWALWLGIHIFFLIGFSNRIVVLVRWAWTFLTHGRGVRLITGKVLLPPIEEPEPPVLAPMEPGDVASGGDDGPGVPGRV